MIFETKFTLRLDRDLSKIGTPGLVDGRLPTMNGQDRLLLSGESIPLCVI